jgi:plastocyanin
MRKTISAALLALAQSIYGQTTTALVATTTSTFDSPATTASSSRPAATFKISVGIDHKFTPDITQALIGDLIEFDFMPLNHSVVRAE